MSDKRKKIGVVIISLMLVILVVALVRFIHHRMRYAVSNAVFVETDHLVNLGFEDVSGRLLKVFKDEGEAVKKGEAVALLDKTPYQDEVKRLTARLKALKHKQAAEEILRSRVAREVALNEALAQDEIERLKAQEEALSAKINALDTQIAQLQRDTKRLERLYAKKLIAKHQLEESQTALAKALEDKKALLAQLKALRLGQDQARKKLLLAQNQYKQVAQLDKELSSLAEQIKALSAALARTKLFLAHCLLKSPINGVVAKRFHVAGDVVAPGEPVLALVDPHDLYILVLLEETKLHGVRPGCPARIRIDAYPDKPFEGVVSEVLPATAAKFALVPRDISAGEFTKVAQRVPVKIRLTKGPVRLLRVGLGGEVEIRRHE